LFGHTASLPKFVTLAAAVAFSALGVMLSRFVLKGWKAYLPSLLLLTAGFLPLPDATHHVFSTLAALAGLIVILGTSGDAGWRPVVAGIFAGLSFCFTHTRGIVVIATFATIYTLFGAREKKWRAMTQVVVAAGVTIVVLLGP